MFYLQGNRGLIIALFLLIFSIYLATYSGRIESGDSLRVADATSSLVHFNDSLRDEAVFEEPPQVFESESLYPFASYDPSEALIVYAASIPYRIAELFPQIGLVHAMWLLNIVIVALCAVCFFIYAKLLAYQDSIAVLGTVLFALATIVWPYSKTLFREPLAMLMLLLTALSLEKWRLGYRRFWWFLLAVLAMVAAFFSKNSTIFALPAFIILVLPAMKRPRWGDTLLLLGLLLLVIFAFVPNAFELTEEVLRPIWRVNLEYARAALHTYLFSIGGSLWATSPVLLLGIGGAVLWMQQGKRRLVYAIAVLIMAYAVGHAALTDLHWFGGLSWPPRFVVPVVPFAALLLLPVIEWLMQPNRGLWRGLALLLILYSVAIQVIASISWQDAYVNLLPAESGALVEWSDGLNDPRYLRWLLLPQSWSSVSFDIAWIRSGTPYFIWFFAGLAVASGLLIWQKRFRWLIMIVAVLCLGGLGFGLRQLYANDQQYWAHKPALFEMLAILEHESENGEPLLLAGDANVTYERFIMNYSRYSSFRPAVLGFQWGEVASPEDSPRLVSRNVTDLLAWDIPRIIDFLANRHERLWWLAHNSEFTTWAIRPELHYLVENYYLLHEYKSDDVLVRLYEFSTVRAPSPYDFRLPENLSELRFGESIRLNGFTLPLGTEYTAGDVIPISLFWQTDVPLDADYTISWFITNEAGVIKQGIDSQPQAGFALTQTWSANQLIIDNRAIELPADFPGGDYVIWLRVYITGSNGTNALPVTAGESAEDNLGVLPIQLIVN
jgi:hypothetical protein